MTTLIEILTNVIADQIKHNSSLCVIHCYEEIKNELLKDEYKGFEVYIKVSTPNSINETSNFQYISCSRTKRVQVANKYF